MPAARKPAQFVILPASGITARANNEGLSFLLSLHAGIGRVAAPTLSFAGLQKSAPRIKVLDSIHENGAKLVEANAEQVVRLRSAEPGIRIVPVVEYRLARSPYPSIDKSKGRGARKAAGVALAAAPRRTKVFSLTVKANGVPVKGVQVIAFTNFNAREGADGTTNARGVVNLTLPSSTRTVDRLFALPSGPFWPFMKKDAVLTGSPQITLQPIDFSTNDCVRHIYGSAALDVGEGVKVGVIDSGIANHPDLRLDGGLNTVTGERPGDFGDNGMEGHGTHVGGIIAARGTPPAGLRGVAPGVTLRSYRVFGQKKEGASNFAIAKAIDAAVADGCDIINMSLGGGDEDPLTDESVKAAREKGCVVLAANGNDNRSPVSFPAAFDLCVAVAAMGRKGTFPANSATQLRVAAPFGTDRNNFVASFSNIGLDTDLTGPGVGVVSTVPGGYGIMDGTSMACPAAAGALARLLSQHPEILSMPRDRARSNAIITLMASSVSLLGFGAPFEGNGLINP